MIKFSKFLKESSYVLLQKLSEKYGQHEIYGDELNYIPSNNDLEYMQSLFNEECFENKLKKISFKHISPNELKSICIKSTVANGIDEVAKDFGAYIINVDFFVENKTDEFVCSVYDEFIYINSAIGKGSLLAMATIVCHEMAHQYDFQFGQLSELILTERLLKKTYDPHTTPMFVELSKQIHSKGLDIMQKVDGLSYQKMSYNIVKKAKELVEVELDPKKYTKIFSGIIPIRFSKKSS